MAAIGPSLPPHLLAKRKRQQEEEQEAEAPQAPSSMPVPTSNERSLSNPRTPSPQLPSSSPKRRKVLGPSLPPAPLDQRPSSPPPPSKSNDDSESESDSDLGPAPLKATSNSYSTQNTSSLSTLEAAPAASTAPERPDWMLRPPSPTSWTSRIDTTKLRSRKFTTGKPSNPAPSRDAGGISETWTETVAQKRQRLEDEVLGLKAPSALGDGAADQERKRKKLIKEQEKRRREAAEKGPSLYQTHQTKAGVKEKEDDPSARAFDREKDIAGGIKIGHRKRMELLRNAKGFGGRFEGGGVL